MTAPYENRQVGIDPSVVGLAGAVGDVVGGPGGALAYVKYGPNATDWQAFPGTSASGGFGSDTLVPLPNASASNVTALELVTSLTAATAGSEVSKWVVSLLSAGVQVTAMDVRPGQTLFPNGTVAAPGVAFQGAVGSGLSYDVPTSGMIFSVGGVQRMTLIGSTMTMLADASKISMGTLGQGTYGMNGLTAQIASSLGDVEIGTDGATATGATSGFLQLPGCAGAPTGVPGQTKTGKVPMIIDSTNFKIYCNFGGTWKSTAALT
jgi:hypothetical protein